MSRYPTLLELCGLGCMAVGTVAGLTATSGAAAPVPTVGVQIAPGPALVGPRTELTLRLSSSAGSPAGPATTHLAVTDLLPTGETYVAGSSRLAGTGRPAALGDPRAVATTGGTMLVWPSVPVTVGHPSSLSLAVRAGGPGATASTGGAAGSRWTDTATAIATRSGLIAPALSASAAPLSPAADLVATARRSVEVVGVRASETGVVVPSPTPGSQRVEEHLRVQTTRTGPTADVTIGVYLPGSVTWSGCVTASNCRTPTVTHVWLPVSSTDPDTPRLAPPAPVVSTTRAPSATRTAVTHGTATTITPTTVKPAGVTPTTVTPTTVTPTTVTPTTVTPTTVTPTTVTPTTVTPTTVATARASFSVLTWRLGTLPAGSNVAVDYRIEAAAATTPRTGDVVTAAGVGPLTVGTPAVVVVSSTVQVWPIAVPKAAPPTLRGRRIDGLRRATPGKAGAATGTTSTSTTSTSLGSTRDPFTGISAVAPKASTTTTRPTSTTTFATTTTTTTTGIAALASTGIDVRSSVEAGLALIGAGVMLVVGGHRRRKHRRSTRLRLRHAVTAAGPGGARRADRR